MNLKPFIPTLAALLMASTTAADSLPARYNGLRGATLRAAVAADFAPSKSADGVVDMTGETDVTRYFDVFSGQRVDAASWIQSGIVSDCWFTVSMPEDLYNKLIISPETDQLRKDFPLGPVENVSFDNGIWRTGITELFGIQANFYEPPKDFRGDFARVFFYYITVYSPSALAPRGYTMLTGTAYPAFTDFARNVLMDYHRADPVSDAERLRMEKIAQLQGNRNPFVLYPALAEYLWGDKADHPVVIPGEPIPLRGTYSLADERIDLVSEFVPADAEWTIDGRPVNGTYLVPVRLGKGLHTLRYRNAAGEAGMLTINITD